MSRLPENEVICLIEECGQQLELLTPPTPGKPTPNVRLGMPGQIEYTVKPVKGYVVNRKNLSNSQIAVSGGDSRSGDYNCYIEGYGVERSEFAPGVKLRFEGNTYNIKYQRAHCSQGTTIVHQLILTPEQ